MPDTTAPASGCDTPSSGGRTPAPDVVVVTHDNRRALFYRDLLQGKVALIHFMPPGEDADRSIEHLSAVPPLLGDRLGRQVFLYSIATQPEQRRVLARLATAYRIPQGWFLLTGELPKIAALHQYFFAAGVAHTEDGTEHCSTGLLRYGNEAAGIWGTMPLCAAPEWIAERLSWVAAREAPVGPPRRRGPMPLMSARSANEEYRG